MKKSTKGALAAGAAGVLLLGGAGSLAYWTDAEAVDGAAIRSGELALGEADCEADWTFDDDELTKASTYGTGSALVPGDVLTKTCTYVITAKGDHLRATVEATWPELSNNFNENLSVDADFEVDEVAVTEFTEADHGKTLKVQLKVAFDGDDELSQNLSTTLGEITVTATQSHEVPAPLPPVEADPVQ